MTDQGHMFAPLQANPHKRLRHLYGQRMMTQYRNVGLGELSPHAYAIAEQVTPQPCVSYRLQHSNSHASRSSNSVSIDSAQ